VIPEGIHNGADFDLWRKEAEREEGGKNAKLLFLKREDLMRHEAAGVTTDAFPSQIKLGGVEYALTYHFEPGSPRDGVTLTVPLAHLNQVPMLRCEWLVPGLLKEKVLQLVKTLPQKIRAKLVPVPEFAQEFVDKVQAADKGLVPALITFIIQTRGLNARGWVVTPDAFRPGELPAHLSMNFKLVDEHGRQLGMSRNLGELRGEWGGQAKTEFAGKHETPSGFSGLTDWTFGELPELMEVEVSGQMLLGYPGLRDDGETVSLAVFDSPEEARAANARGLLRLFMLQFRDQLKYFEKNLPGLPQMGIQAMGLMTVDELKQQLIDLVFARACLQEPWPQNAEQFKSACADAKSRLGLLAQELCRLASLVLTEWQALMKKLPAFKSHAAAVKDIEQQVGRLMHKRFVSQTPFERLQHYPRYLKAVALRLDKLKADPARDSRLMAEYAPLWTNYERRTAMLAKQGVVEPPLEQFRWLLEELRVALFAQELKTPTPVSAKRLQKTWEGMR
jgi:ATP-dependent helicase HrpA